MTQKTVGIVDDSELVLDVVTAALTEAGYRVVPMTEPSRQQFREQGPFDLLLIDVHMPQIFGDDTVSLFKESWGVTGPILLFSSIAEDELAERARASGADGYICKSWGTERLLARVEELLGPCAPRSERAPG